MIVILKLDSQIASKNNMAFTLIEVLLTVSILGVLTAIALPNYQNHIDRTQQNEAASTVSQIQTAIAAYADEFGVLPTSWAELNDTSAVMTDNGPATTNNFQAVTLAGGYYNVAVSNTSNLYTITATRDDKPTLNIIACINLTNGASAISKGSSTSGASSPNCG